MKPKNGIMIKGNQEPVTILEKQQFVQLLTEIAKRLIQEKNDVSKTA